MVKGNLSDVEIGQKIVFSEIEDGIEKNRNGLENFIYFPFQDKDIFIFDNHNHAFFFWLAGYLQGKIKQGLPLVHIDQHSDMRNPQTEPPFSLSTNLDLNQVFDYTNQILNVGNFIQPALELGLFSEVQIIDSTTSFDNPVPSNFVLDIDLDVFSEEMAYIDKDLKLQKIRTYIQAADFITIATSPYFIEQEQAIAVLFELFSL